MNKLKYDNWDKITFSIWNKIEELNDIEDDFEKNIALLSILSDIDEDELLKMPLPRFARLMAQTDYLRELPKSEIKEVYKVNGREYEVKMNPQHFTVNQWIDYNTLSSDILKNKDRVLATVLLPKGKQYGDYDIEQVVRDIHDMPIADIFAINAFFLISYKVLLTTFHRYLVKKMKKLMKMKKMNKEVKEKIQKQIQAIELLINSYK